MGTAIILAVLADILFAVSGVLQQDAASSTDPTYSLKLKLLTKLFSSKMWFIGFALSLIGYFASFMALEYGSLTLVESLMILNFLFALPLADIIKKRGFNSQELFFGAVTVSGLVLFLISADAKDITASYTTSKLILSVLILGGAVACFTLISTYSKSINIKTFWLASGGSLMNTLMALEIKQIINNMNKASNSSALAKLFESPGTYLLIPTFIIALILIQSAFQSEKLSWSLPTVNLINPLAATIIAISIFNGSIRSSWWALGFEFVGVALVTYGIIKLSSGKNVVVRTAAN